MKNEICYILIMKNNYCYFNGKILPIEKTRIYPDDLGILRGYGIFDVVKTCNNKIFLFDDHWKRMTNSAKSYGLKLPLKKSELEKIIEKLVIKNKIKNATVRIVLTAGRSADAMHFDPSSPTFYILISELKLLPDKYYEKGVKLKLVNYARNTPEIKSLNYSVAVRVINESQRKEKFYEVLYAQDGKVYEAATSNFFIFKENTLITPNDNILKGTIRNLVINMARKNFKIEERELMTKELQSANEAFITATNKDIVPVVKIDNFSIGNGKVGDNTRFLMKMLNEYIKNY